MMANIVAKGRGKVTVGTSGRQGHPGAQGPRLLPTNCTVILQAVVLSSHGHCWFVTSKSEFRPMEREGE